MALLRIYAGTESLQLLMCLHFRQVIICRWELYQDGAPSQWIYSHSQSVHKNLWDQQNYAALVEPIIYMNAKILFDFAMFTQHYESYENHTENDCPKLNIVFSLRLIRCCDTLILYI